MDSTRAKELLRGFAGKRILVVGDVVLDHYVHGDVERINPEAPVPILRVRREHEETGGAGNVAKNLAALGVVTHLISVVGDDSAALSSYFQRYAGFYESSADPYPLSMLPYTPH